MDDTESCKNIVIYRLCPFQKVDTKWASLGVKMRQIFSFSFVTGLRELDQRSWWSTTRGKEGYINQVKIP